VCCGEWGGGYCDTAIFWSQNRPGVCWCPGKYLNYSLLCCRNENNFFDAK
jgi:hypothetical protein